MNRNEVTATIKRALQARSGKAWSVTGGTGTAYCWLTITAPANRRDGYSLSDEDAAELNRLLGLPGKAHCQGVSIPGSTDYWQEYMDRAAGREPTVRGERYWD